MFNDLGLEEPKKVNENMTEEQAKAELDRWYQKAEEKLKTLDPKSSKFQNIQGLLKFVDRISTRSRNSRRRPTLKKSID